MFYGREKDLRILEEKWASDRFEFGCIYGTRRIGKTSLINKFLEGKDGLYFQAKEASELENRRGLSKIINKILGYPQGYVFPSWDELLDAVLTISEGKRFAFIIDEYPYLSKSTKKELHHIFRISLITGPETVSWLSYLWDQMFHLWKRSWQTKNLLCIADVHFHISWV